MQHLKYTAHVTRRENSRLQKQFHFCETSKSSSRKWKKFSELTKLDESLDVQCLINLSFKKSYRKLNNE